MVAPLFRFVGIGVEGADGETILHDVDLDIADGGITGIAGPSGAGKSTLLRLCNRLSVPSVGRVELRGDDVDGLDPLVLRRRVGMVFQRPTLVVGTVRDNLCLATPAGVHGTDGDGHLSETLDRVGLGARFLDRDGGELSGGEAQRACLARTLLTRPEVLLMDEPTSALDLAGTTGLERLGRELADAGHTVVWVAHDLGQLRRIADHRVVLVDGTRADPAATRTYLDGDRGGRG